MARFKIRNLEYLEDIITLLTEQCWKTLRICEILKSNITKKDYIVFRSAVQVSMAEGPSSVQAERSYHQYEPPERLLIRFRCFGFKSI